MSERRSNEELVAALTQGTASEMDAARAALLAALKGGKDG